MNVVDARLDVYLPGNTSELPADADTQVAAGDIAYFGLSPRVTDLIDTGEVGIRNKNGAYTDDVRSGARLEFYTRIGSEASLSRRWTGMARTVKYDELGGNDGIIKIDVDDFVFAIMDMREVLGAFEDRQIAGTSTSIVNTLIDRNTSVLDTSKIASFPETATEVYNGQSVLDAVRELQRRVNAVMWSEGKALRFEPLDNVTTKFTLTQGDRGLVSNTVNDDRLSNQIRAYGSYDTRVENELTAFDSFVTVTDTTRLQTQVQTRKSQVAKVELWTDPLAGSSDDLVVRVHPSNEGGSAPVAPGEQESDYARRRLSQEFLAQNDWTTFIIPDHKLVDPNPWILIESTGTDGQQVGVDVNGDPLYMQHYEFPTDMIKLDTPSSQKYRRRENAVLREELSTRTELSKFVDGILNKTGLPDREVQFAAQSERTHNLAPGDAIEVPGSALTESSGDHIVTVVEHDYNGSRLDTHITVQEAETV